MLIVKSDADSPMLYSYKEHIAEQIQEELPQTSEKPILEWFEYPSNPEHGDLALPCFKLAPILKDDPNNIAQSLADSLSLPSLFQEITSTGPYLNFSLDRSTFIASTCNQIHQHFADWSHPESGNGETVVIDYSSPNISKPPHIGHLRGTILGAVLYRIYERVGYEAIGINHLGDWGTPMGKLLVAYERWGEEERLEDEGVYYLEELYIRITEEEEDQPELRNEIRNKFEELASGEQDVVQQWKEFKRISLDHLEDIYEQLGISFDEYKGESHYEDQIPKVLETLEQKGLSETSEGALIVPLADEDLPPFLLKKSDGTTLYSTRDLAAALHRRKEYGADRLLYVVASEQNVHFRQLFQVLENMDCNWVRNCEHVDFGLIQFEGKKMSTREGTSIHLEQLLDTAVEKARNAVENRSFEQRKKEKIAREIGLGAVLFQALHARRNRNIEFDWERAIGYDQETESFRGETGPYLQYSHVRICGILREFDGTLPDELQTDPLTDPDEFDLIRRLSKYPEILLHTQQKNEPSILTNYLIELAQDFHTYYHDREAHQVISDDPELTRARVGMCQCIRTVLADGMELLGLTPLERM